MSGHAVDAMAFALARLERLPQRAVESHHSPDAHDVISAELVACTLGQRSRTELRVDPLGKLLCAFQVLRKCGRRLRRTAVLQ